MATKKNIIKGTTKSGISFQLDENIKNDARIVRFLTKIQRPGGDTFEKSDAFFQLLDKVFGSDENVTVFMDEVARVNKGVCSMEAMMGELNEMFEALNAKN